MTRFLLLISLAMLANPQTADTRDRDFWNARFRDAKTEFNRQPSRLLAQAIQARRPGKALDLGMGEGRNTIFLAQHGWDASGVDLSDVAVGQARRRAKQLHVRIDAVIDDLDRYQFGQSKWDLVALFYMHAWYQGTRPASTQRIAAALKPGGLLVMEGFAGAEKFLFQPNELLRDFAGLRVLRYEDTEDEADWAPGHPSHLIRLVAEKPR